MKNLICYLFHEQHRSGWERWFCHNYFSTCKKCGRNRYTQSPGMWELNRTVVAILISFLILLAIGYLLK